MPQLSEDQIILRAIHTLTGTFPRGLRVRAKENTGYQYSKEPWWIGTCTGKIRTSFRGVSWPNRNAPIVVRPQEVWTTMGDGDRWRWFAIPAEELEPWDWEVEQ